MASSCEDSDDDFVVLGTPVPEIQEGVPLKKPTNVQDLTARDKHGRRRFHGAFTGGFSAGFFNTVGTKEGFMPSEFVSSRDKKNDGRQEFRPEDFMDDEDFEEHGIAPRKFATVSSYTSEERKRKLLDDAQQITAKSSIDLGSSIMDLVIPDRVPIGIKLLRKMGWREGQGLGPRIKKKKKKGKKAASAKGVKMYGCAPPPSDEADSDSDRYVPEDMSEVSFAPQDVCPISLEAKDNVHGLGYRGLDPSLALSGSHINLFDTGGPAKSRSRGKGIKGQAFGVGVFEDEDEDIYAQEDMSQYNNTMDGGKSKDSNFGWTAPREHGKVNVPVSYVGKLLEGFCLSSKPLKPGRKFPPPTLPRHFKPQHWFRKKRITSHLPEDIGVDGSESGSRSSGLTAVDRGLILGETPVMSSVFDLIPAHDKQRIEATKEAISMTQSLTGSEAGPSKSATQQAGPTESGAFSQLSEMRETTESTQAKPGSFLSKFKPAEVTPADNGSTSTSGAAPKAPLFQGGLNFQPFRKDPVKQERYDRYLTLVKQGVQDPYSSVVSSSMTEWDRSRERDEFAKAAKIFRPLSAMMSSRFVRGAMIDDDTAEKPMEAESEKSDQGKAADMKMFGKLTREEVEWHPDKLLCRRFNVPNPYPGSDIVGLNTVKRDKYSVFNFLSFGDYQPSETQEPPSAETKRKNETTEPETGFHKRKKPTLASVFKVLDDPDFHKPFAPKPETETADGGTTETLEAPGNDEGNEKPDEDSAPDMDLFRAIFKNSDSETSDDSDDDKGSNDLGDEKEESDAEDVKDVTLVASPEEQRTGSPSHTPPSKEAIKDELSPETTPVNQELTPIHRQSESTARLENPFSSVQRDPGVKSRRGRSRWEGKSVFSVLDDLDVESKDTTPNGDSVASRLSPSQTETVTVDENTDEYGPRLPPGLSSTPAPSISASIQPVVREGEPRRLYSREADRKRHKHKKEKKKKSKHKKDKKGKKHKKKSSRSGKSKQESSGSEADSESSDGSEVSDNELIERFKTVSKKSGLTSNILAKKL
ncbi:G patch domain-containing protein 1 isoform X2 [Aplysia californica]|uniref:G patch domain-containing protein 1 isoform X2 n=1 Tax=Aplysia californica TaxID=6500 RepID=A0ABM0JBG3_APLCA|nr:G patch domain-containing protein 1 isoform X2 [Aplysia californica]